MWKAVGAGAYRGQPHLQARTGVAAGRADPTGRPLTAVLDLAPDLPLPPVHLRAVRDPASGDVTIAFVRCSRTDADSWTLAEAPLDVTPEAYLVSVLNGASVVRRVTVGVPVVTYDNAAQLADFGARPAGFDFTVAQISPVWGPGLSATGAFHA